MPTEPSEPEDEQDEKRRILANDLSVRDSGTFLSHTHSEAGGRFASVESQQVIGRDGAPRYPALPSSSPWAGPDLVGPEPPLGFSVDEMIPSAARLNMNLSLHRLIPPLVPATLKQLAAPDAASSATDAERAGPSSSADDGSSDE